MGRRRGCYGVMRGCVTRGGSKACDRMYWDGV